MKPIGTKYQIYEGDDFKIYRIVDYPDSHHYLLLGDDGTKKTVKEQELIDKYIQLIPDAFMNIMITDTKIYPDVYVCVNKASSLEVNKIIPDLILRQSLLYNNPNSSLSTRTVTFGMCLTTQTTSSDLSEYMEFKNIEYSTSMALYINDTIDDIFNVFNKSNRIDKVNEQLKHIKEKYGESDMFTILGYTDNLKDLMQDNEFIPRFRELFNVTTLNWKVVLGKESYDKNNNIILNRKQIEALSLILGMEIHPIVVLKYDKDIDISKIVVLKHIIVSDEDYNMYFIAYDEIAPLYNNNDNMDVINAMRKKSIF